MSLRHRMWQVILRRRPRLILILSCAAVLSLVLKAALPVIARQEPFDDALFVRLAASIRAGDWLGPYDNLTLAKGPVYSLFIAVSSLLQIPLKVAEHAVYLGGAGVMAYLVATMAQRSTLGLALFAVLAFNPVAFSYFQALTLRDGLYFGLAFLALSAFAWLLADDRRHTGRGRLDVIGKPITIGALLGVYWLTREEAVWLLPSLVIASALPWALLYARAQNTGAARIAYACMVPKHYDSRVQRRAALLRQVTQGGLVAVGGLFVLSVTALGNLAAYGVAITNDYHDGAFPAVYGAFTRVESGEPARYIVAPASARSAIYAVSPTAAELKPWLERPSSGFIAAGCKARQYSADPTLLPSSCDDYYAGWFTWALRDAIQRAGHWTTAVQAQAFMAQVAAEVDVACRDGRLLCRPRSDSLSPSVRPQDVGEIVRLLPIALERLVKSGEFEYRASYGDTLYLLKVASVSRAAITPPANRSPHVVLEGWVAARTAMPTLDVAGGDTAAATTTLELRSGADVEEFFASQEDPGWHARRFSIETTCLVDGCSLAVTAPSVVAPAIGIAELVNGSQRSFDGALSEAPNEDGVRIHFERVEYNAGAIPSVLAGFVRNPNGSVLKVLSGLQWSYSSVMLPGLGIAFFGLIASALFPSTRRRYAPLLVIAAACGGAVAVRLTLITILELKSWPSALRNHYLDVASPFMVTFVVLGAYLGWCSLQQLIRRSRRPVPSSEGEPT